MDDRIHDAYESVAPTSEQEERMLANILAYAESQNDAAGNADDTLRPASASASDEDGSQEPDGTGTTALPDASPKRPAMRAWRVAVPVAACIALLALFVGVGSLGSSGNSPLPSSPQSAITSASTNSRDPQQEPGVETKNTIATGDAAGSVAEYDEDTGIETMALEAPANGSLAYETEPTAAQGPAGFNTEEYAAVDENGFVSTAARPLSTVSADVDTASYANLRRLVSHGARLSSESPADASQAGNGDEAELGYIDDFHGSPSTIPSGAVRVEEMVNYFSYDYEKPTDGNLFSMQAQASTCPWNPDTKLLVLGFATPYENAAALAGANLVFLIDVSGSMDDPDKLPLLQDSFATLLESLDGDDRVSIVTYSGSEEVVLEGAHGDDSAAILKAIYRLKADGSTNGEAGLRMAYKVAERNFIEGGVNRIIMASDGDLNVGMTSQSDLYDFVDEKRDTGVYLSVLGFGSGNYKDTKMEVLADHGNGSYHYIDCIDEAKRVLVDKLMANLVPFADDVKVQVEFNPAQIKGYRLIGYENRALADEDFDNDEVDAGDIGPNAQFTVAYEIVPVGSAYEVDAPDLKYGSDAQPAIESGDWLTCALRYHAFADDTVHEQDLAIDSSFETAKPSDDWKFASSVIEFAMVASQSDYLGTSSIDSVLGTLESMQLDDEREGFHELVSSLA